MTFKRCVGLGLALGAVGFLFRAAVWAVVYDQEAKLLRATGLVVIFNLFLCLCGALTVIFFLSQWPSNGIASPPYSANTPVQRLLRFAAALCSSAAGVLLMMEQQGQPVTIATLSGLFLAVQGVIWVLLTVLGDKSSKGYATLILFPAFFSCFWLVSFYHQFGSNPVRQTYLWPIAAGILTAAAWVAYAGFSFEPRSGRRFGVLALLAMLSLPTAAVAPLSPAYRLSLMSQFIWFWASLLALNVQSPQPDPEREELPYV